MKRDVIIEYTRVFEQHRDLGTKGIEQLDEKALNFKPEPESNSIALIVKHLHGNMLSRWTNFLTEDGEKEWRNRDQEFESEELTIEEIQEMWLTGWKIVFQALDKLQDSDLSKTVYIRSQPHTVQQAIVRQVAHYSYHTGQIVYLAKMLKGKNWISLSIPKGKSEAFNKKMRL